MGGQSHSDWVLDEILWGQVTNFLLHSVVLLSLWEQLGHFLLAQFGNISDVVEGLDLLKMHQVMDHPELVVVVHGNIERLHSLRSGSTLSDSSINLEFGLHEICVFSLNLVDNLWGMDILLIGGPVDWLSTGGTVGSLVVVVQDGLELRVLFTGLVGVSGSSKSVEPFGGQFVV